MNKATLIMDQYISSHWTVTLLHHIFYSGMEYNAQLLLGHAFRASGCIDKACEHYQIAESLSQEQNDDQKILAFIFQHICIYAKGQNTEALSKLRPLVGNPSLSKFTEGILKQALGNICRSTASWHSAITFLEESIKLAHDMGDLARAAERSAELGRVYRSSGQYQRALELQKQFYDFALSRGDLSSLAAACGYLGFTTYSLTQPDFDKAVVYLATRLSLSEELEDRQGFRWCLNNIGKCYLDLKHPSIALQLFTQSAEIAKELNDLLGEGTAYGNMGTACRALNKHEEAVIYHTYYAENALKRLDTGGVAIMQNELALDHLLLGDLNRARTYALLALQTGFEIRARLAKEDDVLKISNFEKNQAKTYAMLQHILAKQGLKEACLLISEMGRARALADLVERRSKVQSDFLAKISCIVEKDGSLSHEAVQEAMVEIGKLVSKLKSNLVVYSLVESPASQIKETYLYTWLIKTQSVHDQVEVHFRSVLLSEDEVAESAFTFNEGYFNSLMREVGVKESSLTPFDIAKLSSEVDKEVCPGVDGATRDIVIQSQEEQNDAQEDKLSQLHAVLISPIESLITKENEADTPRIIFIPQSYLFNIPFPALKGPKFYAIEQFVISMSPSIYLLHLASQKSMASCHPTDVKALTVGNPKMPLEAIHQLPGAENEASSINSIINGKLLCGLSATKAEVTAHLPHYNIIHLATHAILGDSLAEHLSNVSDSNTHKDGDYSIKGAVVLAKSDASCSGILTSTEIQKMSLKSELVVLSCCRTGCGKVTGDGILGLSRSIISAGADSLIVTLWSIYDESTAKLMKHFYLQYKEHRDAPFALRQAMLQLVKNGYNLAHWGAFCLLGVSPKIITSQVCSNMYIP